MVNHSDRLGRTFAALGDPTRRAILARLERVDAATVSDLARPFRIKLPAVMKHLDVLGAAGLITRIKSGRAVTVRLNPRPMREAMAWLQRYQRFWSTSLALVRRIKARPAIVFDALTTPEGINCWWGPDGGPVLIAETDVRVGGRFRVRFRTLERNEHETQGKYLEVQRPSRLTMSWRWRGGDVDPGESRVVIELVAIPEGTELTVTHSGLATEESALSHTNGWNGSLDKLKRHVERSA